MAARVELTLPECAPNTLAPDQRLGATHAVVAPLGGSRVRLMLLPPAAGADAPVSSVGLAGATARDQSVDDAKPKAEGAKNDEHNHHALWV